MHRHKFLRHAAAVLAAAALLVAVVLAGLAAALPDTLYTDGPAAELEIASMPYLTVKKRQGSVAADSTTPDTSANVTLTLFGTLPVKTVRTVSTERRTVQVCGTPFGVKMFSDGALVVAFSDRYTALGSENPAKAAGLRLGDLIVSANGRPVRSNEDLTAAIQAAGGAPLTVVYRRSGARHTATLTPDGGRKRSLQGGRLGAGLGRGHRHNELCGPAARHIRGAGAFHQRCRHRCGSDAALRGNRPGDDYRLHPRRSRQPRRAARGVRRRARRNRVGQRCRRGLRQLHRQLHRPALPVANLQEVTPGEAELWTTVLGTTAQPYTIQVERVTMTGSDPNRNLLIRVTDKRLLDATGGVVQGMSGSPIVQNGRLAAVLTHVLVNDPSRGYAIFATTMLEKADAVANSK